MNLFTQFSSQIAPIIERDRGITISSSHVEYSENEQSSYVAIDTKIDRPFITAVPVMFYRRINEG